MPAEFSVDADRLRRFEQEACAASALNHPNIITVYDVGGTDTGRFIVMELVAGRTASHALNLAYQEPTEEALERATQAIESLNAQGVMLSRTRYLARMGEVHWMAGRYAEGLTAIAEALALVERTGERVAEAEIWRIKGELLLGIAAGNAQPEAESCYHQAIKIARQQNAKSWELRAAKSLARLWQRQGKTAAARQMLAEIYGWFTDGFGTADLKDAKA